MLHASCQRAVTPQICTWRSTAVACSPVLGRRLHDPAVYFDVVVRGQVWNVFVGVELKVLVALLVRDTLAAGLGVEQGGDVGVPVDDRAEERSSPAPVPRVEVHLAPTEGLLRGEQTHKVHISLVHSVVQACLPRSAFCGVHVGPTPAEEPDEVVVLAEGGQVHTVLPLVVL